MIISLGTEILFCQIQYLFMTRTFKRIKKIERRKLFNVIRNIHQMPTPAISFTGEKLNVLFLRLEAGEIHSIH